MIRFIISLLLGLLLMATLATYADAQVAACDSTSTPACTQPKKTPAPKPAPSCPQKKPKACPSSPAAPAKTCPSLPAPACQTPAVTTACR